MKYSKLTIGLLTKLNIKRKPFRSLSVILLIMLFSIVLFVGIVMSISLSRGVGSLSNRLGADVMVVPKGHEAHIDSILLTGEPSSFYLPTDAIEKVKAIEGVDKVSPQTYLATLSASCCSYPVQIIGIDPQTDFLIKPWLEKEMRQELKDGQVILGYHVSGEIGDELKFFGKEHKISGRLEQTGMSFDQSVFMNKATITKLAVEAERKIKHPLSEDGSLVSTIMVKLKPGYESEEVAREITNKYSSDGIFGMFSKKFVNKVSADLTIISSYIVFSIVAIGILSFVVISMVFMLILNERKKEMASLRVLGVTKKKLTFMIVYEAFVISLYGTVIGTALGTLVIAIFNPIAIEKLNVPYLLPRMPVLILIGFLSLVLSSLVGPLASLFSAIKLNKNDVYSIMRGNE